MSVLIKDIEKPKFCYTVIDGESEYCPFVNTDDDCVLLLKKGICEMTWEEQYSKCPLVETPEPCDDPRADVYYLAEEIGIHRLYALVVALRGEPEPCEDAVSRADVEIEIANLIKGVFVEYEDIAKKVTARLPSVTPERKKGEWIKTGQSFIFPEKFRNYSCSECGYDVDKTKFNFCPNCGADNREDQDDNNIHASVGPAIMPSGDHG